MDKDHQPNPNEDIEVIDQEQLKNLPVFKNRCLNIKDW
jgi:hypothetical protein